MKKLVSIFTAIALMATILVGATLTVSAEETNVCLEKTATADVKSTNSDKLEKLTDGVANNTSNLYRTSGSVTWSENAITIDLDGTFSLSSIKIIMYANDTDLIADDYKVETGLGEVWNEVQAKTEIPEATKGTYPEFLTTINPAVRADKIKVTFYKDSATAEQIRVAEIEAYGVEATDIPDDGNDDEEPVATNVCLSKNVTTTVPGKASAPVTNMVDETVETRYTTSGTDANAWNVNVVTIDLDKTFVLDDVTIKAFANTAGQFNFNWISVETGVSSGDNNVLWTELIPKTAVSSDTKYLTYKYTIEQDTYADWLKITFYKDGGKSNAAMEIQEIEALGIEASADEITGVTGVTYKQNSEAVSACPANGEFTVSVAYTNVESPLVLVAFYDANGNLLDVATGSAGTELQCSVSSAATISKARIFTWETTTLKPLLLTAYDYID